MHKVALVVAVLGSVVASSAPAAKVRTVAIATPTTSGALDARALEAVVRKSRSKLLTCVTKPDGEFNTTVTFTIGTDGTVANAEATGGGPKVQACVAATFSKFKFATAKETTGVVFQITYMLVEPAEPDQSVGILGSTSGSYATFSSDDISSRFGDPSLWGTGAGYGAGAHTVAPLISIGQPTVTGDLGKATVRRYVKRNLQKLQYCYEKELLVTKTLNGTITAAFTITPNGTVSTATASGMKNKTVESCIASVIQTIEFPKPHDGNEVTVSYPFTFTPPPPAKKTK